MPVPLFSPPARFNPNNLGDVDQVAVCSLDKFSHIHTIQSVNPGAGRPDFLFLPCVSKVEDKVYVGPLQVAAVHPTQSQVGRRTPLPGPWAPNEKRKCPDPLILLTLAFLPLPPASRRRCMRKR